MTDRDKLIDKLRKLKAHAKSASSIGNEEEAQAFAGMVQTLLARHKLDASEVEWEAKQKEAFTQVMVDEAYPSRRQKHQLDWRKARQGWETLLALQVARSSSCRMLVIEGHAAFYFYGMRLDAEGAKEAFLYLRQAAETLGEREYVLYFRKAKKAGRVENARGFKGS